MWESMHVKTHLTFRNAYIFMITINIIGYREYNTIGCLVNYEYVYCPGGTKVYGTGSMFATGKSKAMFMEQVEM
jgi:hypothetical protein